MNNPMNCRKPDAENSKFFNEGNRVHDHYHGSVPYSDIYIVLVEGDDDINFYKGKLEKAFPNKKFAVCKGNGKQEAMRIIHNMDKDQRSKKYNCICIVDCDYDWCEQKKAENRKIFYTDTHDLETMLLFSQQSRQYIFQTFANRTKIYDENCINELFSACIPLGFLRMAIIEINKSRREKLKIRDVNLNKSMQGDYISKDFEKRLLSLVKQKNADKLSYEPITDEIITEKVREKKKAYRIEGDIRYKICQGHDMIFYLLNYQIKKIRSYVSISENEITEFLIKYYPVEDFMKTNLYKSLDTLIKSSDNKKD